MTKKSGFSILEMSLVMVIIGVIITFSVDFIKLLTSQNLINDSKKQLEIIDEALAKFVLLNGRLPCPARINAIAPSTTFGVETDCSSAVGSGIDDLGTSGNEEVRMGALPTRNLGLSDLDSIDPWGYKLSYIVVTKLAESEADYGAYTTTNTDGIIILNDGNGNPITTSASTNPVVAYLVFSHGSKYCGAYAYGRNTVNSCSVTYDKDAENYDDDASFIIAPINDGDVTAQFFDDVLSFKLKRQLDWELSK